MRRLRSIGASRLLEIVWHIEVSEIANRTNRNRGHAAPRRFRDVTPPVSLFPKTILFAGFRAACGWVIFARYQDCRGILSLDRFGFARAVINESAFKPHS